MRVLGLHHAGVYVTSLERSIAFYRDAFGLEVAERLSFGGEEIAFLAVGTSWLELIMAEAPRPTGVVDHVALEVTDLAGCLERLPASGATLLDESPIEVPGLNARIAFCLGPDNERIELFEQRPILGRMQGIPTQLGHVALRVRDLDRAVTFYRDVMGLTLRAKHEKVAFLGVREDASHEIALFALPADAPGPESNRVGMYHMAWEMASFEDLEQFHARLLANAAHITGYSDRQMNVMFTDPDGNEIEAIYEPGHDEMERLKAAGPDALPRLKH